jgi:hypothetical protein
MLVLGLISPHVDNEKGIVNSFIIYEEDNNSEIQKLFMSVSGNIEILSFEVANELVVFELSNGYKINAQLKEYYFCKLKESSVIASSSGIDYESPFAVMILKSNNIERTHSALPLGLANKKLHLKPYPHFLNLDWRFSWKSINSILQFVTHNAQNQKICYLGCPSLALYHNVSYSESKSKWELLDKGHPGLDTWMSKDLIPIKNYRNYDVINPVPDEVIHAFDVVIMDPPWYEEYYKVFWIRALSLIKPNGIIGLSEYPGYKKKKSKILRFKETRDAVIQGVSGKDFYCSLEVSYSVPPFEKSTGQEKDFTHAALDAYRPAYMDFYKILNPSNTNPIFANDIFPFEFLLENNLNYEDGHSLRYKSDIDFNKLKSLGAHIGFRTSLKRVKKDNSNIIAWSSRNCVAQYYSAQATKYWPNNEEELFKLLQKHEKNTY